MRQAKEVVALEKSEALAEEGDVDGSQLFATQAEAFAQQHAELLRSLSAPERIMTVCEICGVFMQQLDNSDPKRKARAEEARLCFLCLSFLLRFFFQRFLLFFLLWRQSGCVCTLS